MWLILQAFSKHYQIQEEKKISRLIILRKENLPFKNIFFDELIFVYFNSELNSAQILFGLVLSILPPIHLFQNRFPSVDDFNFNSPQSEF